MTYAQSNPAWNRDEDILALDLYIRKGLHHGASLPGKSDKEVVALSALLQRLPFHHLRAATFRNPDGVARKLSNLRSVQVPGTGSTNHSRIDELVWSEFKDRLPEVRKAAEAIRQAAARA
jgi:5-methylcytosine-specific restriction enzyme A